MCSYIFRCCWLRYSCTVVLLMVKVCSSLVLIFGILTTKILRFYTLSQWGCLTSVYVCVCVGYSLQKSVYLGSASEVVQLPMSTCGRYSSCYDCVFSRDPFCAWDGDGEECVEISSRSDWWAYQYTTVVCQLLTHAHTHTRFNLKNVHGHAF